MIESIIGEMPAGLPPNAIVGRTIGTLNKMAPGRIDNSVAMKIINTLTTL